MVEVYPPLAPKKPRPPPIDLSSVKKRRLFADDSDYSIVMVQQISRANSSMMYFRVPATRQTVPVVHHHDRFRSSLLAQDLKGANVSKNLIKFLCFCMESKFERPCMDDYAILENWNFEEAYPVVLGRAKDLEGAKSVVSVTFKSVRGF